MTHIRLTALLSLAGACLLAPTGAHAYPAVSHTHPDASKSPAAYKAKTTPPGSSAYGPLQRSYLRWYKRVTRISGRLPGRNIVLQGVVDDGQTREARASELKQSLTTLQRMAGVNTSPTPVPSAAAATGTGQAVGAPLSSIAACESGGNPGAVSPDGLYRGKYQFSQSTWEAMGGTGDPAAAPEAVQDAMAAKLYAQQGASPWPTCGR